MMPQLHFVGSSSHELWLEAAGQLLLVEANQHGLKVHVDCIDDEYVIGGFGVETGDD